MSKSNIMNLSGGAYYEDADIKKYSQDSNVSNKKVKIQEKNLKEIATAINIKENSSTNYNPSEMAVAINNITTLKEGTQESNLNSSNGNHLLAGDIAFGKNGAKINGTMPNNGAVNPSILNAGDSYTIPIGYHNGQGVVQAKDLASQTQPSLNTIAPTTIDLVKGKSAWINGKIIKGSMQDGDLKKYKSFYIPATGDPIDITKFKQKIILNRGSLIISTLPAPLEIQDYKFELNGNVYQPTVFYENQNENITIYSKDGGGVFLPENTTQMFSGTRTDLLDLSNFNTSNVIDMSKMFANSTVTQSLYLSNFDTSNVINMSEMFMDSAIVTLDLSNFDTSKVMNMDRMFTNSAVTQLDLSNFNTSNITNMEFMFAGTKMKRLDLSSFNTSNVTDMNYMFAESAVIALNLSSFDTSKVKNMQAMFAGSAVAPLDLSNFDTKNVNNMNQMFANSKATSLNLSSFNTVNVNNMNQMFANSEATSLNLSSFNTVNVSKMGSMFANSKATSLDLSSFNTENVYQMDHMFAGSKATSLDLSNFDTGKVKDMRSMFNNMSDLTYLNISNFTFNSIDPATKIIEMFTGIPSTTEIILPPESCGWHREGNNMVRNEVTI